MRFKVDYKFHTPTFFWEQTPKGTIFSIEQPPRAVVDSYRAEIDKKMSVAVGESLSHIDGGRPGCRLHECAFGDFGTDAMAAEMDVDMAIMNSGTIKGSFNKGK